MDPRAAPTFVCTEGTLAAAKDSEMKVTPRRSRKDETGEDHGRLQNTVADNRPTESNMARGSMNQTR